MEIKDILYNVINDTGVEEIRMLINKDMHNSKDLIYQLFKKFEMSLKNDEGIYNIPLNQQHQEISGSDQSFKKLLVASSEALLHFLLSSAIIPSERKILYKNVEIDIVIPNLRILKTNPSNAIVILFNDANENETEIKIDKLNNEFSSSWSLENLWIISYFTCFPDCKNYILKNIINLGSQNDEKNNEKYKMLFDFKNIVIDINTFLNFTKDKSMKILPI